MKLIFSEKCLEYSQLGHPESPGRVKKAYDFLRDKYDFLEPESAFDEDLLKVHSKDWVEIVKTGSFFDFDSPAYKNVYEYARLSAGGAILAAKEKGFSLMRPPGHHVGRGGRALGVSSLGFCYFNNIAVAVRILGLSTLILDIDGHHGNGTQEIFSGDPKVMYVSLHRYPYYPGTGYVSEANCLNYPLPSICGDELYLETLDEALGKVDMKNIDLIAISVGFDAHQGDLASLGLSSKCYGEIGKKIGALKKPTFGVLEGGYVGENVGRDLHELIQGLGQ